MRLYEIHIHELPRDTLFVRVSHPDGTVWAIPSARVIAAAARYYEEEGWDEEPEGPQPTEEDLVGIMWANSDTNRWTAKERWSEFADIAILLKGVGTIPPRDDELWWFEEQGGSIEEMTTLSLPQQCKRHGRLLCIDDAAMRALKRKG